MANFKKSNYQDKHNKLIDNKIKNYNTISLILKIAFIASLVFCAVTYFMNAFDDTCEYGNGIQNVTGFKWLSMAISDTFSQAENPLLQYYSANVNPAKVTASGVLLLASLIVLVLTALVSILLYFSKSKKYFPEILMISLSAVVTILYIVTSSIFATICAETKALDSCSGVITTNLGITAIVSCVALICSIFIFVLKYLSKKLETEKR